MKSGHIVALSLFAAAACAHREPVQHTTISTLNSIASCMKRRNVDDALVVGSADPRGSDATNQELGKERARRVAEYLKKIGVSENDIRIRSVGESQASAQPSTWPASRRAEVQTTEGGVP